MRRHKRHSKVKNYTNKIIAVTSIMISSLGVFVLDDATALVMTLFFAVPLFFSNKHTYYR